MWRSAADGGVSKRRNSTHEVSELFNGDCSWARPGKGFILGGGLRRVREPEWAHGCVVRAPSLLDLAACNMAVVQSRAEAKDYLDIAALLRAGVSLARLWGLRRQCMAVSCLTR